MFIKQYYIIDIIYFFEFDWIFNFDSKLLQSIYDEYCYLNCDRKI